MQNIKKILNIFFQLYSHMCFYRGQIIGNKRNLKIDWYIEYKKNIVLVVESCFHVLINWMRPGVLHIGHIIKHLFSQKTNVQNFFPLCLRRITPVDKSILSHILDSQRLTSSDLIFLE